MLRRICRWLMLSIVFVDVGPLLAQIPSFGNIAGQIRVANGSVPSHQILVDLRLHGATLNSTYASAQGQFSFSGIDPNEYHIVIDDPAYSPVDQVASVSPENLNIVVTIALRPAELRKNDDPLTGHASGSHPYLVNSKDYNKRFSKTAMKEYERGLRAERNDQSDQAVAHYEKALKIAPDYYPAHNNLGSLYLGRKNFSSAESQFRDAIRLEQDDAQAYFNLGNVLFLTRRYSEAETAISAGLKRAPNSAFGYFLKGCLSDRTGKYAQGEKDLRQALSLDSTMWQAHLQLVDVYLEQGRRDNAISELRVFLKVFPSAPAAPKARDLLHRLQSSTAKR